MMNYKCMLFIVILIELISMINGQRGQTSSGCKMTLPTDMPENEPVYLLKQNNNYSIFTPTGRENKFKINSKIIMFCPGKNNMLSIGGHNTTEVTCNSNSKLTIGTRTVTFNTLNCTKENVGNIKITQRKCSNNKGSINQIGYQLTPIKFIQLFEVCFNNNSASVIYTKHTINGKAIRLCQMPFYSKDWRDPGDFWIKTQEGWERLKVLECGKRQRCSSESECINSENVVTENMENETWNGNSSDSEIEVQPHCHITIKCTREIAGFNGLGEAVRRLDFRSSVRNHRRFQYICTLLRLLVANKAMTSLPGGAQRLLLQMIEEVADYVSDSQQNLNILRGLVIQLQELLQQENQKCWGKPLGSKSLWLGHVQTIERIQQIASQIQIKEPGPEICPKLHDLPEECIREIILRMSDHRDLEASSAAWSLMAALISEQRVWRELATFHYSSNQIKNIFEKKDILDAKDVKDWKKIYHDLRKLYGVREDLQYAEILSLCRFCRCLFWPSAGHPCIVDQCPDFRARLKEAGSNQIESQPVPPAQFLKFFSL